MTRLFMTVAFLIFWSAVPACAPTGDISPSQSLPVPLDYEEHQLENGLRVVTHEDHSTPVVHVELWYHVGAKDEPAGRTGFAHLFEHLMSKGSANVEPEEHGKLISSAGGFSNAYTTEDVTVYYETVPANHLETVLWLEADRMESLDVSEANFLSEREVVKEERLFRVESPPFGDLFEILYENAYDVHPYRHTPIGSMEDLNRATIADVREFYDTFYVPSNAYLVIAGDFDTGQAMDWVRQHFGSIPAADRSIPRVTIREPAHTEERRVTLEKEVPLPAYVAGYYIPEDGHPDAYPLIIASMILAEGRSSRVYQSLVYDKQLALEAQSGSYLTEDPNLFFAILYMNQGASAEEAEVALETEFRRMMEEPVTDAELTKAKNQIRASYIMGRQTVEDKAGELGHAAVIHQDANTADDEIELLLAVTEQDIMRVVREYLNPNNRTVLTVWPAGSAR